MFKIVVCVKAVPDPKEAHKIKIDPATKTLTRADVPLVLNLLDKNAMEAALQLKKSLDAHITILSMGPPPADSIVKECLALGADQGFLLSDRAFGGADAYATAYTLAKGIEKIGAFDLIICGMASSDGSTEWVGPEMATFLKIPVVTRVTEIVEFGEEWWKVKASLEKRVPFDAGKTSSRLYCNQRVEFSEITNLFRNYQGQKKRDYPVGN